MRAFKGLASCRVTLLLGLWFLEPRPDASGPGLEREFEGMRHHRRAVESCVAVIGLRCSTIRRAGTFETNSPSATSLVNELLSEADLSGACGARRVCLEEIVEVLM